MAKRIRIIPWLDETILNKQLKNIGKRSQKVNIDINSGNISKANRHMNQLGNTVSSTDSIFSKLKRNIANTFSTSRLTMTGFLMVLNEIRKAGQDAEKTINDIDKAITDLSIATNMSRESVSGLVKEYNDYAKKLSSTTTQVTSAADDYLRAGKSMSEAKELIKDSIMLSKLGQIDSAEATEDLLAVMNGYSMSVEEVSKALDAMVSIDMAAATSSGDIATALKYCASSADVAGVSFDKLASMIGTVQDKTQQSSETVGTFMNTLLSRYRDVKIGNYISDDGEDLSDYESVLKSVNISLRNSENEFRNYEDVLQEMANKWSTLSSVQQAAIAKTASGVRQQNRFYALMEGYNKVLELTEVATNSAGTAVDKFNNSYMNSLEAKKNTLQASFESMIMNSNLDEVYSGIIDATNALVNFINETNALEGVMTSLAVGGGIKAFLAIRTGINQSYITLNKFKQAMDIVGNTSIPTQEFDRLLLLSEGLSMNQLKLIVSTNNLSLERKKLLLVSSGLSEKEAELQLQTWGLTTANNGLAQSSVSVGNAMKGAGASLKSFASAHKLSLTIVGVAIALSIAAKFTKKLSEENEKLDKKIEDTTNNFSEATTKIDEINTKLEENKKRINEINKLKKPTYVDEQDLKNLKEQNKLLEKEKKLLEASKQKNAESKNKALAEKFQREYTSNDARNEDLTKSDDAIDIITFKGARGAVKAFTDTDTKDDKLSKSLTTAQSLFSLSKLSEDELTKYNDLITKRLAYEYNPNSKDTKEFKQLNDTIEAMGISIEDALAIGSVNSIIDLQKKVETNNESLEKQRDDLLKRLKEYSETDPNYESEGAQEILRRLNEIYKYTNTEEWINDTINEVLDGDIFADKVNEINTKIENGEKISYDKLISDKTYDGLIKEIAKNLYGATDDISVKKAASYLADYINSQISEGINSTTSTLSTFEYVFNSDNFSDAKEKLLELASAGELTPETLESTEDYNKLITETGLKADEACKKINEYVSASQRLNVTANGLSSLTNLYKQSKENGFVEIESIEGLSDAFKDLESYNDFVNIVGSGTYTMDEMQKAFNKLTSEYLMHTKVLDGLTESNQNLYVQQLKNYGVVNAQEIVDNELAHVDYSNTIESYFKAAQGSEEWKNSQQHLNDLIQNETNATLSDFTDGNYEAQQSLLNESNASYVCRQAILDLQMAQYDFNQTKLNVDDNIKELAKLADSYGLTNSQAQTAAKAMDQVKQMQDAGAGGVGLMYTEEQLADFQKSTYDEIKAKLQADFNNILNLNDGTQFDGGSDYQKELAKNSEKANSEAEKSKEIFDWIETKIKRLQTVISEFGETASNVFKSLTERSSTYGNQISKVTEEISLQQQAYDAYMQKANSVGLSEEYASKVRNGAMNIDEISDETLKTQISDYQTWYDKAQDCLNTVNDLQEELAKLNIDRLQLSIDKINNKLEKTQTNADKIKARIDDTTRVTKASDYDKLDVNYNQQIKSLSEENKLIAEQQKYVQKDSEKWIELEKNIRDNNTSISDLKKNIKENKVLRIEIKLEAQSNALDDLEKSYDKIQDKISLRETSGQYVSSKDYDNLNKNISKQITKLKEQNKAYADLQKQVKKGSKDWNDYKDNIDDNNTSIRQLTQSMVENSKAKADLIQTKTDEKVGKIDSADELLDAKIQNTSLYNKKNAYTSSKIGNIDKRLAVYNNNVKTFSSKVNSSKNSINKSKANKSFLAKIKTYTKKNKVIPSELITQAEKLGYNNLATQCADYNSYLDSLEAAKITAELYKETSKKEKADLAQEKADNIETFYSNRQSVYTQKATELNNKIDLIQSQGYVISENYYSKLIANEKNNNALLVNERDKLVAQLNKSVANGDIKKGSDEWYAMCQQINNVTNAIDESTKSLVEYQNAMRQLKWDNFDYLEERIGQIVSESDFMINQLSRRDLVSDDIGGITEYGKATNALHLSNYTAYKQQSYDYKHQIDKINAELEKKPYDKNLISRKEELVKYYQQCIDKAQEEKYAIIDLYTQGYEALKNKIGEVINEYTELLDKQKNMYDYQNSIVDKTKQIAQIRKQLEAYNYGDTSEETQATVQKLKVSLEDAEKDLKDTQYDKFISDTKDILSDLQDNLSDDIKEIIKNMDDNFQKLSKPISKLSETSETITTLMNGIGYTSTDNFKTLLNGTDIVTSTKAAIRDTKEFQNKMLEFAEKQATSDDKQTNGNSTLKNDLTKAKENANSIYDTLKDKETKLASIKEQMNNASLAYDSDVTTYGKNSKKAKESLNNFNNIKKEYDKADNDFNKTLNKYNNAKQYSDVMEFLNKYLSITNVSKSKLSDVNKALYDNYGQRILSDNEIKKLSEFLNVSNNQKKSGDLYKKLKSMGINGFRVGSNNIPYDQIAMLSEAGQELQFDSSQGVIRTVGKGDMIFTHEMAQKLWDFAKQNPVSFDNKFTPYTIPNFNSTLNSGDVNINMGGIVMNGVNDPEGFTNELHKNLATNPKTIKIMQANTIGSLSKNYNSLGARKYL